MNCDKGDKYVEDEIYYFKDHDFFNFSPFESFKFFVEKNDQLLSNIQLWFYNLSEKTNVKIIVNGIEKNVILDNFERVDLEVNKFSLKDIQILYNFELHNLTNIIDKLKHSTVQIL
jgi:hypothetical protein